ncbi:hypothetical protein GGS26DRAFT_236619 [Hypomontagnella submonticulosa]|nr:hypothetical protein GGS26DRAFT_236619 [Hypomontagnella submonticulosa]
MLNPMQEVLLHPWASKEHWVGDEAFYLDKQVSPVTRRWQGIDTHNHYVSSVDIPLPYPRPKGQISTTKPVTRPLTLPRELTIIPMACSHHMPSFTPWRTHTDLSDRLTILQRRNLRLQIKNIKQHVVNITNRHSITNTGKERPATGTEQEQISPNDKAGQSTKNTKRKLVRDDVFEPGLIVSPIQDQEQKTEVDSRRGESAIIDGLVLLSLNHIHPISNDWPTGVAATLDLDSTITSATTITIAACGTHTRAIDTCPSLKPSESGCSNPLKRKRDDEENEESTRPVKQRRCNSVSRRRKRRSEGNGRGKAIVKRRR